MAKDFLIVPPKAIKTKDINRILERLMSNKKIKISSKNYIVIGNDEKIVFDVSDHFIKGKLLTGAAEQEENVVNRLISNIGTGKIYVHYYGNSAFLENKNTITI